MFAGNKASAICSAQHSRAWIDGGVFKDGRAPFGAGFIASDDSTVEVYSSNFVNNTGEGGTAAGE
jgi:hypothetical protein